MSVGNWHILSSGPWRSVSVGATDWAKMILLMHVCVTLGDIRSIYIAWG